MQDNLALLERMVLLDKLVLLVMLADLAALVVPEVLAQQVIPVAMAHLAAASTAHQLVWPQDTKQTSSAQFTVSTSIDIWAIQDMQRFFTDNIPTDFPARFFAF